MQKRFSGSPDIISQRSERITGLCISQHAKERMISRQISKKDVERVLRHGLIDDTRDDRVVRYIPESPFYQVQSQKLEGLRGCRVIVSRDGVIVTVMWKEDDV
ncbi:DUF4258 domain-containing protein [Salinispira pacifica]|uniref:DUF4258 domain-containing protein n=1 Tax=Salinispira pacifica TaxID=1307761 RepID=UPI00059E93FC